MTISFFGAFALVSFGIFVGVMLGWCFYHPINRLSVEDLREELDERLKFQELEFAERKLQAKLVAARRREVPRLNTGAPARVSKISISHGKEG